jgi:hypothetical protein
MLGTGDTSIFLVELLCPNLTDDSSFLFPFPKEEEGKEGKNLKGYVDTRWASSLVVSAHPTARHEEEPSTVHARHNIDDELWARL